MGVTRATHGVSIEAYAWKMCTRVRWAGLDSLIVIDTLLMMFGYLCMVRIGCKSSHVNQLNLTKITCLRILNLGASRLMSSLVLFEAFACLVVIFWSPWMSLAERSHSSFALVVSCVEVRNCFLFSAMPMRIVSGRTKPMRVELRTRILRLRVLIDGILF
jgi:hypothetical protein